MHRRVSILFASGIGLLTLFNLIQMEPVLAAGHFPDLNDNPDFRSTVTQALDRGIQAISYVDGGVLHHYLIRHGEDYEKIKFFFRNPLRERLRLAYGINEADHFSSMLEHLVYFPLQTDSDMTLQYETAVKRPHHTADHGVDQNEIRQDPKNKPQNFEIPYVEGAFVQVFGNATPKLVYKVPEEHPPFQGPYFTFTLTEVSQEYFAGHSYVRRLDLIKETLKRYIRILKEDPALKATKTAVRGHIQKRSLLEMNFVRIYEAQVRVRAQKIAENSGNALLTFYENYTVTREDLTPAQSDELDAVDIELESTKEAYDTIYSRVVSAKYLPKFVIPYLRQELRSSPLFFRSNPDWEDEDETEEKKVTAFLEYQFALIGATTAKAMQENERFQ